MKAASIALGVICAILVFVLYQRGASASREIESLTKDLLTTSNQVAESRTRMVMGQVTNFQTVSNLVRNLDKRTGDLNIVSNRLVQTHLLLQAEQKGARASQEEIRERVAKSAVMETENEALRQRASRPAETEVAAREKEALHRQLVEVTRERDETKIRYGALQVEMDALQAQLFDLEFLERQRKDAEAAADIRRRLASGRAGAAADPRRKLELQADGTVRYVDTGR